MFSGKGLAQLGVLFVVVAFNACSNEQEFVTTNRLQGSGESTAVAPSEDQSPKLPVITRHEDDVPPLVTLEVVPTPVTVVPVPVAPQPPPVVPANIVVNASYTQQPGKLDLLWVIDNSISMAGFQNSLASQFAKYAQVLSTAQIDFQLGVTTTDVCSFDQYSGSGISNDLCPETNQIQTRFENGKWVGGAQGALVKDGVSGLSILKPGADFVSQFQRIAKTGVDGSTLEYGLHAAHLAIDKSMGSGVNAGLIRPDAALAVVILSDEEDQESNNRCMNADGKFIKDAFGRIDVAACDPVYGTSPYRDMFGVIPYALWNWSDGTPMSRFKFSASDFVTYLGSPAVKPQGNFKVSTFTGMLDAAGKNIECNNPALPASAAPLEVGSAYIKAAQLTGGLAVNICTPDWASSLQKIAESALQLVAVHPLTPGKPVVLGTLVVKVNGVLLPATEYSYDLAKHQILFKSAPAVGSAVEIVYESPAA